MRYVLTGLVALALASAPGAAAEPAAGGRDVATLSLSVTGVKLLHDVDGGLENAWTVKVFIRNTGAEPLSAVDVGLAAWAGPAAKLPPEGRFLDRRGHSTWQVKAGGAVAPGASKAVEFTVRAPAGVKRLLLGALADGAGVGRRDTAEAAQAGRVTGKIAERDESNNWREVPVTASR